MNLSDFIRLLQDLPDDEITLLEAALDQVVCAVSEREQAERAQVVMAILARVKEQNKKLRLFHAQKRAIKFIGERRAEDPSWSPSRLRR